MPSVKKKYHYRANIIRNLITVKKIAEICYEKHKLQLTKFHYIMND